jgi:hypothetical protein
MSAIAGGFTTSSRSGKLTMAAPTSLRAGFPPGQLPGSKAAPLFECDRKAEACANGEASLQSPGEDGGQPRVAVQQDKFTETGVTITMRSSTVSAVASSAYQESAGPGASAPGLITIRCGLATSCAPSQSAHDRDSRATAS